MGITLEKNTYIGIQLSEWLIVQWDLSSCIAGGTSRGLFVVMLTFFLGYAANSFAVPDQFLAIKHS